MFLEVKSQNKNSTLWNDKNNHKIIFFFKVSVKRYTYEILTLYIGKVQIVLGIYSKTTGKCERSKDGLKE